MFLTGKKIYFIFYFLVFALLSFGRVFAQDQLIENSSPASFQKKDIAFIGWGESPDQLHHSFITLKSNNKTETTVYSKPTSIQVSKNGDVFVMDYAAKNLICIEGSRIKYKADFSNFFSHYPNEYALDDQGNAYLMATNPSNEDIGKCLWIGVDGSAKRNFRVQDFDPTRGNDLRGIRFSGGAIYNRKGKKILNIGNSSAPSELPDAGNESFEAQNIYRNKQTYIDVKLKKGDQILSDFKYPTNLYFRQAVYGERENGFLYVGLMPNLKVAPQFQDILVLRNDGSVLGLLKCERGNDSEVTATNDIFVDDFGDVYQVCPEVDGLRIVEYLPSF